MTEYSKLRKELEEARQRAITAELELARFHGGARFCAVIWEADGQPKCLVDSTDPHGIRLEGFLQMLQLSFPNAKARLVFVVVSELVDPIAETLRPPRSELPTLYEVPR